MQNNSNELLIMFSTMKKDDIMNYFRLKLFNEFITLLQNYNFKSVLQYILNFFRASTNKTKYTRRVSKEAYVQLCSAIDYYILKVKPKQLLDTNIQIKNNIVEDILTVNNKISVEDITISIDLVEKEIQSQYDHSIKKVKETVYTLQADSSEKIIDFCNKAFKEYIVETNIANKTLTKKAQKFYYKGYIQTNINKTNEKVFSLNYDYNELTNTKNFDSLFFKNKKTFIKMITDFRDKDGIYKFPNIPHKLGILLHGVPGTGKTSIIKSLSNFLDRHIVTTSLTNFKTNKMFSDFIMNSQKGNASLFFKDVIYLFEDFDAVQTKFLKSRKNNEQEQENDSQVEDEINLSGVLNVLDGVIDTPGMVIIYTTNKIGDIDEAFFRPGRIDINMELGYLNSGDAVDMIKYYNNDICLEQEEKLLEYFKKNEITPARLENMIREDITMGKILDLVKDS